MIETDRAAGSLLAEGYDVHGLIRRSSSFNTGRLSEIYQDPHARDVQLKLHYSDLSDPNSFEQIVRTVDPHEVYNLADELYLAFRPQDHARNLSATGGRTQKSSACRVWAAFTTDTSGGRQRRDR